MNKFIESRKHNAVLFMREQGMDSALGGVWTNGNTYDHILKIGKGNNQFDVIKRYNLLKGVEPDMFSDPHRFAHHLTSSQVMCYNFFRPLIGEDRKPSDDLVTILAENGIVLTEGYDTCAFETANKQDNTSYDMTIGPVTFEIKFTENGFGTAKDDDRHKKKFESVYKVMLDKCQCLISYPERKEFLQSYQLYRNVLHIDNKSKFAVFVFPKGNVKCMREFTQFHQLISDEYKDNVQAWYWEDLAAGKEDTDFFKKYLR